MKKIIIIVVSLLILLAIIFFFPKKFTKFESGMVPLQYSSFCQGLYIETFNDVALDGGIGGLCFGKVEKVENPKGPCPQGMNSSNTWCDENLNSKTIKPKETNVNNPVVTQKFEFWDQSECTKDSQWIKLLYPVGGETFHVGEKIKVRWTSCNIATDEKVTSRINWDGMIDGLGYGTGNFDIGTNDGEEEIKIPEKVYNSTPQMKEALLSDLGSALLYITVPNVHRFPNVNCPKGTSCMPGPIVPQDETKTPLKVVK